MKKRWDVNGCFFNDDKIKVGEYARTDNGLIIKVDFIDYNDLRVGTKGVTYEFEDIEGMNNFIKTVKHSSNIIDFIGYGDFINGKMCIDIEHYTRDDGTKGINFVCIGGSVLKENIKSIVTKEQFESVEFRLED